MKRILVIKDDALWLELNRHLAGRDDTRVDETPSLTLGLRLAQIEAPDLIVCRAGEGEQSLRSLGRRFRDRKIDSKRVICVHDDPAVPQPPEFRETGIALCHPDDFLLTVDRSLRASEQSAPPSPLDVLAHYQLASAQPGEPQRGFVNLLEVGEEALAMECSDTLQNGDHLSLNFLLPRAATPGNQSERIAVSLDCEVAHCLDPRKLHYSAKILKVEEDAREPLRRFIRSHSSRKGSP